MQSTQIAYRSSDLIALRHAIFKANANMLYAFNHGDVSRCADYFEEGAVLRCNREGIFVGREAIAGFWCQLQQLREVGASALRYTQTMLHQIDDNTAALSGYWNAGVARGEVMREVWTLQPDGEVRIIESEFHTFYSHLNQVAS